MDITAHVSGNTLQIGASVHMSRKLKHPVLCHYPDYSSFVYYNKDSLARYRGKGEGSGNIYHMLSRIALSCFLVEASSAGM
jgi:hypothetical protein